MTGNAKTMKMRQAKRLVEQLLAEVWSDRGKIPQAAIASWFGVNPSIVSNVMSESRPPGPQFMNGAVKALGLKPAWFTDPRAEADSFWQWVADKDAVRPPTGQRVGDKVSLITGVGKELGLDFDALGRLMTAMSVVEHTGGDYGRAEVITMAHALGLAAPSTGTREIDRPSKAVTRLKR